MRHFSFYDQIINKVDKLLQFCCAFDPEISEKGRPCPKPTEVTTEYSLSAAEKRQSVTYMRINHTGEVCAQALYLGQALVARTPELVETLNLAADEERDHLRWCRERLNNLEGRTSYLNPLFAVGSYAIGILAGLAGDKVSLGFLAETEKQVTQHLDTHLKKISPYDVESRAILEEMKKEEIQHATHALVAGGTLLPYPIRLLMQLSSKVMTYTTRFL
jgi:ubiquinone biosynthesis monooxygenase Coq7